MKILVLHNNNLPSFLRKEEEFTWHEDIEITSIILKYDSKNSNLTFDSFISNILNGETYPNFPKINYDLIILPYTFNEDNYIEYSGLRIATHIRLTKEWHHRTAPILFLGPDSLDDITRLSEFGNIITSYRIFMSDAHDEDDVENKIRDIIGNNPYDGGSEHNFSSSHHYAEMVSKLVIKAPTNYATHHSLANEWAILRWIDMIKWSEKKPEVKDKSILDQLYFKYLLAKLAILEGEREFFDIKYKKKNPVSPIISDIKGKKIIYFDDEGDKGWYSLLDCIFKESKAELIPFPMDKEKSFDQMLEDAKSFADKNPGDCYLIDLRLHDNDFNSDAKPEELSGYKLADYIKNDKENGNRGRQIVFFSASNKLWNYEKIQSGIGRIGKCGFVVKESPEYNYTRNETEANFSDFKKAIKTAIDKSYISDYVNKLNQCLSMRAESWNALDQFVDMLLFDEKYTVKYNVLNLYVFIDSYLDNKFHLSYDKLFMKPELEDICAKFDPQLILIDKENDENKKTGFRHIYFLEPTHGRIDHRIIEKFDFDQRTELPLVMVALRYYYNITEENCNRVQRLRTERNRCVAHNGGNTNLTIMDIRYIFENIVIPIIKKDFPQPLLKAENY